MYNNIGVHSQPAGQSTCFTSGKPFLGNRLTGLDSALVFTFVPIDLRDSRSEMLWNCFKKRHDFATSLQTATAVYETVYKVEKQGY